MDTFHPRRVNANTLSDGGLLLDIPRDDRDRASRYRAIARLHRRDGLHDMARRWDAAARDVERRAGRDA